MTTYIGIDLGTTNSVICSYNGTETRIWKSPEQNDVTPSAIYIDRRGNKYLGKRAYDAAPQSKGYSATLFKRVMGTSTPVNFSALGITKTPEDCSAEILQLLFGYLPEEIRTAEDIGTVITVPAAFNQMQKEATLKAAGLAGLGRVALMQEPVAAVMSVMRTKTGNGLFLIYDLGGGTLDIAIAESLAGRVNLLINDGIAMCGGRDFDRLIYDNLVRPWLQQNFNLPDDFAINPAYEVMRSMALWAIERAKIELSAGESSVISLSESETRTTDLDGNEIYLDIALTREMYDPLIAAQIADTIDAARAALNKAGIQAQDIERIVFVGGPTQYKPLRDNVCFELGIPGNTDVNPMTAVAEGASLFAESIDWQTQNHLRKNSRGQMTTGGELSLSFSYLSRTPDEKSKVALKVAGEPTPETEFQIDSLDTGWTSGRMKVRSGVIFELPLTRPGDNTFNAFVFNASGPVHLEQNKIVITRTAATVDAIPASHSLGIEALSKLGGSADLYFLIKAGDSLPHKGKQLYKAAHSLKAGSTESFNFKIWEGEISDTISDNRFVGVLKISGTDFDDGVIPAGAELEFTYEVRDSGNLYIEISVPSIGMIFDSEKNYYAYEEGQPDFTTAAPLIIEEGQQTLNRLENIDNLISHPDLKRAREKLQDAINLDPDGTDSEKNMQGWENNLAARKLMAKVRKAHLKDFHQTDLDNVISFFDDFVREHARPAEIATFENLSQTAKRYVGKTDKNFEHHLDELKGKNFAILWRQDWFVVSRFKWMVGSPHQFTDKARLMELSQLGNQYLQSDDIDQLRTVVHQLGMIKLDNNYDNDMFDIANIVKG